MWWSNVGRVRFCRGYSRVLPSQSRLCECFFQFGKCFLFSCLGRGNFRCRSFFLLFFREQVDVVLRVFRFILFLVFIGFFPVYVIYSGLVLYLTP